MYNTSLVNLSELTHVQQRLRDHSIGAFHNANASKTTTILFSSFQCLQVGFQVELGIVRV